MSKENLIKLIEKYDFITVFGHVYPDGDCYGGQIGLKELILHNFKNKKVFVLGSGIPSFFSLLGHMDTVSEGEIKNSLALVVDVNDEARVEDKRFRTAKEIFVIDHHILREENKYDGWYNPRAAAVSEMIASLLISEKYTISKTGALALGLGIVSDTGRFLYDSVTEETFQAFNALMTYGIRMQDIYPKVYEVEESDLIFNSFVYNNYKKTPEGVIYIYFEKEDLERLGVDAFKAVSKINLLANIKGFPVWAAFAEGQDFIKGEIRSGKYAVQPIAHRFGGGGHRLAAGMPLKNKEEVLSALRMLGELIK